MIHQPMNKNKEINKFDKDIDLDVSDFSINSLKNNIIDNQVNQLEYKVKIWDNLTKIAKAYNTTILDIQKQNNIKDINKIYKDQKIIINTSWASNIKNPTIKYQNKEKYARKTYIDFDHIQSVYEKINNMDDKSKIIEYNKLYPKWNYIIINKKEAKIDVYSQGGYLIDTILAWLWKNKWDEITMNTNDDRDNNMSGAGIYNIHSRGWNDNIYQWNSFILKTERWVSQAMLIHQIPRWNKVRYNKMITWNPEDRRYSNGCVNIVKDDFKKLEKYIDKWSQVYVLPEEGGNKFIIKNGKINFTTIDLWKKYGKYNFTPRSKESKKISYEISMMKYKNKISKKFMQTLIDKKTDLMDDIWLDNDEYNNLCKVCFGILWTESKFWTSTRYHLKENNQWVVSWLKKKKWNTSDNSRGLTQIKPINIKNNKIMEKYNIKMDWLNDAENAAIATMVVLWNAYKELKWLRQSWKLKISIPDKDIYYYTIYMYNNRGEILKWTAEIDKSILIKKIKKYSQYIQIEQEDIPVLSPPWKRPLV